MSIEEELRREVEDLRRQVADFSVAESEWQRLEKALRESERRLATLLSNLPGMAYRCRHDAARTMQFVSDGCRVLTGRDRGDLLENSIVSWNELTHEEDRERVHEEVRRALTGADPFEIVYRIRTVAGDEKWVWERGTGASDEEGRVEGLEGFVTDISDRVQLEQQLERRVEDRTSELADAIRHLRHENAERERAEEALRQSEAKYRSLIEASPDAVIMSDLNGQILLASHECWTMLGLPSETELVGRTIFDFVDSEDRPRLAANLRNLVATRVRRDTEYTVHSEGGTPVPVEVASSVVADAAGRPHALMAVIRDISDRKQSQEALQTSEERFRAIFEEAPVGMVIANADRTIARASKTLCRMTGYRPEDLIGRHVQEFMHPEDRDLSEPQVEKLLSGEISSFTLERRYIASGGRVFWAQATTATINGPDGRLALGIGIIEDIDDRKRAQEALERERKTLWHMLRSSDHERQLIAYDIHDGLAQQLAAAIMQFQSYEHLRAGDPTAAATAYEVGVQMVRQAHFEARRLISGIRPPILDESGIVAALAHLIHDQQLTDGPSVEFQSNVQFGRLEPVLENAIYRIAQEALGNACRHSQSPRARLTLIQEGESVRLGVRDWGVGFDPESVGENRFGLEGIRERTRLLGGQVTIESELGEGSRVEVVLPLMTAGEMGR